MVVVLLLSNGDRGTKLVDVREPGRAFRDVVGGEVEIAVSDDVGMLQVSCPPGAVAVWVSYPGVDEVGSSVGSRAGHGLGSPGKVASGLGR